MTKQQEQLRGFHQKFGLVINDKPHVVDLDTHRLRVRLHQEEAITEFAEAWWTTGTTNTLIDIADALGDALYVILGSAVSYGIDLEPIFEEIHRSNMTKIWSDGTIHRDEGGKVIKPPTYSPANLRPIIEEQLGSMALSSTG